MIACVRRLQPRSGQVASRRTRESTRDQRLTPAGARLTGRLGFHSRRPSKPPSRDVEHDRGESSGSAALAARRAGYPWTEQMSRKLSRKVRETRSSNNQKRSEGDRKWGQHIELGIRGLRSWGRNWSRKVRETRSSSSEKRSEPVAHPCRGPGLTHHNSEPGSYGKFHILSKPRLLPFSFATFQ